jgi:hypothetical protein
MHTSFHEIYWLWKTHQELLPLIWVSCEKPFLFRFEPKRTKTPSCFDYVSVCFMKLYNFCFGSSTETRWNRNKLKWTTMKINKAKKDKSQRNEACFASEVGSFSSTETLKKSVLLFCETTKINLFSDSLKLVLVQFWFF